MWNKAYWKATVERMIRGAAVAVGAVYLGADKVFDSMNVNTWTDVFNLAISGAFLSLVLSIGGNAITKSGPSFNNAETTNPPPPPPVATS